MGMQRYNFEICNREARGWIIISLFELRMSSYPPLFTINVQLHFKKSSGTYSELAWDQATEQEAAEQQPQQHQAQAQHTHHQQ